MIHAAKHHLFFSIGDPADSVFYLLEGQVRVSAVSAAGKEAAIRLADPGDFFGEQALAAQTPVRVTMTTASTDCAALRIVRREFLRAMVEEDSFSSLFASFLLYSSLRYQADVVDHLFNPAEKRLARMLLLLAESSPPGEDPALIPDLSQEALANMIGSTRPRVNGFLNRFRKLGYVQYNGRIRVRKELLSAFLRENGAGLPGRDPDYCWRARKRSMNFVSNSPARNSVS